MSKKNCLLFDKWGRSPSAKTRIWGVLSSRWITPRGTVIDTLGTIKWYAHWRRYVFFPEPSTLYDAGCLAEIAAFIKQQMEVRP